MDIHYRIGSILCTLLFLSTSAYAQNSAKIPLYKEIQIEIKNDQTLNNISKLGIDLICGSHHDHSSINPTIKLVVSDYEYAQIQNLDLETSILIDDLSTFYAERAIKDLPDAIEQLSLLQSNDIKSIEAAQDLGCVEMTYPVPVNFELGSMGGFTTLDEMLEILDLMKDMYPNLISAKAPISNTNSTIEGRDVYFVKISDNPEVEEAEAEVLYTGIHHAREPLSMMNQLYFMWYLLENYNSDPSVKRLVDNTELYFIPVVNPDGYVYNQTTNPNGGGLWRKNRRDNGNGTIGVDPNRNYGYNWGYDNQGSSPNPASETYRGPSAFSEPCTQMVRDFVLEHNFTNAFNNHSFSNLNLHAWGYTDAVNPHETLFEELSEHMCWHNRYSYGNSNETIYPTNGDANDWFYGDQTILSWTPEIGTSGEGGFWPSPSFIVPQCDRHMKMSLVLAYSAANFGVVNDLTPYVLQDNSATLTFGIDHMSIIDGGFNLSVSTSNTNITNIANPVMSSGSLSETASTTLSTNITIDANTAPGTEIVFDIVLNNGTYDIYVGQIVKIFKGAVLLEDDASDLTNWTTGSNWNTTGSESYSGGTSFTDSPGDMTTSTQTISLLNPLDLTNAEFPVLEFYTKWEITKMFDYVEVQASTDGNNWFNLCGNYTKVGPEEIAYTNNTLNQPIGQGIYDGLQESWVREQMDLLSFAGNPEVYIRFVADGDSGNGQLDGIYIDDIRVYAEPDDGCIDPNLIGTLICPDVYDPVCGCDNVTYSNSCDAQNEGGITEWTLGECPPTCEDGIMNGDEEGIDCGGLNCIACPTCFDGIQNGNETGIDCGGPDCPECPEDLCPALNFNVNPIIGYDPGQDFGPFEIQDGGITVYMDGNAWKACEVNYTVTSNTVIAFDFKSTAEGEIHEVSYDNDLFLTPAHRMVVYGNQGYEGTLTNPVYSGSGDWESFVVHIGDQFTGFYQYLVLTADDDADASGNSFYRNVRLFEDLDGDLSCDQLCSDSDGDGVCDAEDCEPNDPNVYPGGSCDDGNACTDGDIWVEADGPCECLGNLIDTDGDGICDTEDCDPTDPDVFPGAPCDDGDPCTQDEIWIGIGDCDCLGNSVDTDGDGVCDAEDCEPNDPAIYLGGACDDGDICTENDTWIEADGPCECLGDIIDTDEDGVCDAVDCDPNDPNVLPGAPCDDGNPCTVGEIWIGIGDCDCLGNILDTDDDGVCDAEDCEPNNPEIYPGAPCNDSNACTINDVWIETAGVCDCLGTSIDSDEDGVCDAEDCEPNNPNIYPGGPCDDGNDCTTNDTWYEADGPCVCIGDFIDTDEDGVCDAEDCAPNDANVYEGASCDDGDNCTTDDVFDSECNCIGLPIDDCGEACQDASIDGFEQGFGNWNDGGSDCAITTIAPNTGLYSIRIRDNTGSNASLISNSYNLSNASEVNISFSYWPNSMETNEDFFLEGSIDGGSNFDIISDWVSGTDFSNNQRYDELVSVSSSYFESDVVFRFRCDASGNADRIYLDDIVVQVCTGDVSCEVGGACDDMNECTEEDSYDMDCNCIGVELDTDEDGICDALDQCPDFDDNLLGTVCDDGDDCTIDDIYLSSCECAGVYTDEDDDGFCVGEDPDDQNACIPIDCEDCSLFNLESFETDFGLWNDGGSDCARTSSNANTGVYSVRLRDNSGSGSSLFTDNLEFSNVASVDFEFSFIASSMETNEDFFLEYSTDGGASYTIHQSWISGTDFVNNIRYEEIASISIPFTDNTRFRFRCDASSNADRIYLDDISFSICLNEPTGDLNENEEKLAIKSRNNTEIKVWPNPVSNSNELMIELSDDSQDFTIQLLDSTGKLVKQKDIKDDGFLEIENVPIGLYYLKIQGLDIFITKQILIVD